MDQAGDYSATLTYLKAVKAVGHDRFRQGHGGAEEHQDQRHVRQGRLHPRRRRHDPRHVRDAGEDAAGIEISVGLLQGGSKTMNGEEAFGPITGLCPLAPRSDAAARSRRGAGATASAAHRDRDLRHPARRDPRAADARAGERLVLRHAEPRAGGDLRADGRGQLRPRRLLHPRRIRRAARSAVARHQLLGGAAAGAAAGRCCSASPSSGCCCAACTGSIPSTACC